MLNKQIIILILFCLISVHQKKNIFDTLKNNVFQKNISEKKDLNKIDTKKINLKNIPDKPNSMSIFQHMKF